MNNNLRTSPNDDLLDAATLPPRWQTGREPPLKHYGRKIAGGIACSFAVYFFMHAGVVVGVLRWTCEIGGRVLGRPGTAVKLDELEPKAATLFEKGKKALERHPVDAMIHKDIPPVIAPVREAVAVAKKVEDVKVQAKEGVQKIGEKVEEAEVKVVGAIKGAADSARGAVGNGMASVSELFHARTKAREDAQRAALEGHAARIGFEIDKEWPLPRLYAEVADADRKWQLRFGSNGQCPNPRCHHALRIRSKRAENVRCLRCGAIFASRTALAIGPPRLRINY